MQALAMERPLTRDLRGDGAPLDLRAYEKVGGYRALRKALGELTPSALTSMVKASNLRGRGGAGFPTGIKWQAVPMGPKARRPKYVVCNADEMEPGTFKDRLLLEGNPHLVLEGMMLAAYAVEAEVAYVFLRWAYRRAEAAMRAAIAEAYEHGYLGQNILGSPFSLDLHLHTSAGRYICGEETALLNSLEGSRAIPRAKPPYPQTSGLWGKPVLVQNVETLANVPPLVEGGVAWYQGLSRTGDQGGTKIYGASGRVKRPGAWELPMGTTIREILEEAGGMRDGFRLRGVIPGGASTDFVTEEHLDVKMDFTALAKVGSRMGTGTMIVLDDQTCPVGMVLNLERFFARESCGWCTPCREGLPWAARTLQAIELGQGQDADLELLAQQCRLLGPGHTFCALAPGAVEPLQSALKYFREDFQRHIRERRCPWEHRRA
jgi:NADH-quinone oxidoreductase subunit F